MRIVKIHNTIELINKFFIKCGLCAIIMLIVNVHKLIEFALKLMNASYNVLDGYVCRLDEISI